MKNRIGGGSRRWHQTLVLLGVVVLLGMLATSLARAQQQKPTPARPQESGGGQTSAPAAPAQATGPAKAPSRQSWFTTFLSRHPWIRRNGLLLGGIGGAVVFLLLVLFLRSRQNRATPPPVSSDVIGGYRLQNLMMTGQSSQVWEVVEVASGRHFAMKLLLPEKIQDPEHRDLLFHEAEVGIALAHPNVIRIIKVDRNEHNPYFVMEFFPAGNLKLRIMHKKWDFIRQFGQEILKQTATGLAYMNASGWVHRDVKPDNILVNSAGEVRIIDFALAQRIAKKRMFRRRGKTAGTRSYMSPEQVRGEALDARADVYSFGAAAYEMVTGRPPFRAATPSELLQKQVTQKPDSPQIYNPDVTDEFAALVLRMLAKKREERPKDFHEVLMKLRNMSVFKSQKGQPAKDDKVTR